MGLCLFVTLALILCIFLAVRAKKLFEENDYFWAVMYTGLFSVNLNTLFDVLAKIILKI